MTNWQFYWEYQERAHLCLSVEYITTSWDIMTSQKAWNLHRCELEGCDIDGLLSCPNCGQVSTQMRICRSRIAAPAAAVTAILICQTAQAVVPASRCNMTAAVASLELRSKIAVTCPTACKSKTCRSQCRRLPAKSHYQQPDYGLSQTQPRDHTGPHHLPDYYILHRPWL
jgi:hypothetical protein